MVGLIAAKPADLQIPRLSTGNFKLWKELVVPALKGRAVWDYADGSLKEPSDETQAQIWRQNNAIAVGIIKGTLSDVQLGHVMGIDDAKEAWNILKRIHQSDDRARLKSLLAQFMRFKLTETIDEGASKLTHLQSEIGNIDPDSRPSDSIKTEALLASLGIEYEATLAGIDGNEATTYEDVVSRLRRAENRIKGEDHYVTENMARMTQSRPRNKAKNGIRKARCFHCGDEGHLIRNCEVFLAEIRQEIKDEVAEEDGSLRPTKNLSGGSRAWSVSHQAEKTATTW